MQTRVDTLLLTLSEVFCVHLTILHPSHPAPSHKIKLPILITVLFVKYLLTSHKEQPTLYMQVLQSQLSSS